MGHAPTVAELLAQAKKKRNRIQRKAISDVEKLIPPILGPGGKVAPSIARGVVEVENALMDYALDQLSSEFGSTPLPFPHSPTKRSFDPDNPITRFLQELQFPGQTAAKPPRVRSDKQLINDQIQSRALKSLNVKARKKDGSFKKGWNQKKVMRMAQRECTKERERLGLCKKKPKRKKSSKRNPYDSRLALTRLTNRRR